MLSAWPLRGPGEQLLGFLRLSSATKSCNAFSSQGWLAQWPAWWVPHWQPCVVKGLERASCLHFSLHLPSLDLPRSTESFVVVVKGPHRGCEPTRAQGKTPGGWRRSDGHSPPNSAWVFLANSHSSWNKIRMFLTGGKHLGHYPESMPPFP